MICQATRSESATVTLPSQSPDGPYRLSAGAAHRLQSFSLRPREWFNLAAIHGPFEILLHDDFYNEEGEASQPEEDVVDAALFPCPTVDDCAGDPVRLLDFAITRWWFEQELVHRFQPHKASLADIIQVRFAQTKNGFIRCRLAEVAGGVLEQRSAAWFRSVLKEVTGEDRLELLFAGHFCLPPDEGLSTAIDALSLIPPQKLYQECLVLARFQNKRVLDWIEVHAHEPITRNWGSLAAVSGIEWNRVAKWLCGGRPLSLIALDALVACIGPRLGDSLLMRSMNPRLLSPAPVHVIEAALTDYARRDPVPRVEDVVKELMANMAALVDRAGL